jgi:alginate O-acetyltransferase complex protein AlgI
VYQGALLVVYRWAGERWQGARWIAALDGPAGRILGWAVMFHLTCYGWLIFRADSASTIARMTAALGRWDGSVPATLALEWLFYSAPLLLVHGYEAWRRDLHAVPSLPLLPRYVTVVGLAYLTLLFGEFGGSQFIYFQF